MILIHFFGGIHEVYFPYVLANPLTIIGMIAGGIVGTGTLTFLNVGTVATPSPGSIFSVVALSPKNCMFGVLLSVVLSCVVSFLLNAIFVKRMVAKWWRHISRRICSTKMKQWDLLLVQMNLLQ